MSDFSSKGYITLDELDQIAQRLDQLEKQLGISLAATNTSSALNMVFYKNDSSSGSTSSMLDIKKAGIDAQRIKTTIDDKGTITIKFGQSFITAPIVTANADSYKDDFLVTVDSVTKDQCVLRFIKVASKSKSAAGKKEYVNVIAVGRTSD